MNYDDGILDIIRAARLKRRAVRQLLTTPKGGVYARIGRIHPTMSAIPEQPAILPPAAPGTVYKIKLSMVEYLKQTAAMLLSAVIITIGLTEWLNGRFADQAVVNTRMDMTISALKSATDANSDAIKAMLDRNNQKFDGLTTAITDLRIELAKGHLSNP